jgi:hypothetical protein
MSDAQIPDDFLRRTRNIVLLFFGGFGATAAVDYLINDCGDTQERCGGSGGSAYLGGGYSNGMSGSSSGEAAKSNSSVRRGGFGSSFFSGGGG